MAGFPADGDYSNHPDKNRIIISARDQEITYKEIGRRWFPVQKPGWVSREYKKIVSSAAQQQPLRRVRVTQHQDDKSTQLQQYSSQFDENAQSMPYKRSRTSQKSNGEDYLGQLDRDTQQQGGGDFQSTPYGTYLVNAPYQGTATFQPHQNTNYSSQPNQDQNPQGQGDSNIQPDLSSNYYGQLPRLQRQGLGEFEFNPYKNTSNTPLQAQYQKGGIVEPFLNDNDLKYHTGCQYRGSSQSPMNGEYVHNSTQSQYEGIGAPHSHTDSEHPEYSAESQYGEDIAYQSLFGRNFVHHLAQPQDQGPHNPQPPLMNNDYFDHPMHSQYPPLDDEYPGHAAQYGGASAWQPFQNVGYQSFITQSAQYVHYQAASTFQPPPSGNDLGNFAQEESSQEESRYWL